MVYLSCSAKPHIIQGFQMTEKLSAKNGRHLLTAAVQTIAVP